MAPAGSNDLPDFSQLRLFERGVAPVDLETGPDGEIYYVDLLGGTIHRIHYTQAPIANAMAQPSYGVLPLDVQFDGGGSTDPGGGPVTYAWDLDGDGTYDDSTSATPRHTYTQAGTQTARLQVTDAEGSSSTTAVTIEAGDTPPTPIIDAPSNQVTWKVGDRIAFNGHATDDQQGTLDPAALSWSLVLQHCPSGCHQHLVQSFDGTDSGSFVAPDHEYHPISSCGSPQPTVEREACARGHRPVGGSDPEGQPLTYLWEQVDGPTAVLSDEDKASATVAGVTGPTSLTFRLTVTDSAGGSDSDLVAVTVPRPK